jgi:RNA polymerase sigma-70 factor (ECF subfamily)
VSFSEREHILATLRERIVAFAASRISRDVAEDLAQEVLILLHEKYAHVQRLDELLPLSLQIVRFKMMGLHRKSSRRGEYTQVSVDEIQLPDDEFDPSVYVERREMLDRLTTALAGLGDRCRRIFRLKLEGRSFEEIRAIMGAATINTVYTWDFRCRKQLLDRLGGSWDVKK